MFCMYVATFHCPKGILGQGMSHLIWIDTVYLLIFVFFSKSQFCSLFQEERADCFAFIALCPASVNIMWYFLAVPWVGLQFVIVVFPDRTHLLIY